MNITQLMFLRKTKIASFLKALERYFAPQSIFQIFRIREILQIGQGP